MAPDWLPWPGACLALSNGPGRGGTQASEATTTVNFQHRERSEDLWTPLWRLEPMPALACGSLQGGAWETY